MPWDEGHDLDVQSLPEQKCTSATLGEISLKQRLVLLYGLQLGHSVVLWADAPDAQGLVLLWPVEEEVAVGVC